MTNALDKLAWDDFRLIGAVAESAALPAAAARLGLNHSTVFRRLRQIETRLGTALFERDRTRLVPTSAGEAVVGLARRIAAEVDAVSLKLAGREPEPEGEIRVATNDSLLIHLLTPIFATFRAAFPRIRLDVVTGNPALNLSRRDADVAIRATDQPPDTLVGRKAARIAWALYGRAADFADRPPEPLPALYGRTWLSLGDSMAGVRTVRYVAANVAPERVGYRINSVLGLAEAVEAGLGIGHLPCFVADTRPALLRLQPPDVAFATDLWLLTHADLRGAARIRAFLDLVGGEIARRRALIEGRLPDE